MFGEKFTTDLDVSYTFAEKYTLTVGAANVFDDCPDKVAQSADNPVYPIVGGLENGKCIRAMAAPSGTMATFWYMTFRIDFGEQ